MALEMEMRATVTHFIKMFGLDYIRDTDIERFMNYREEARRFDMPLDIYLYICEFLVVEEVIMFSYVNKEHLGYNIDTWRIIMYRFFPNSIIKMTKDEVMNVKSNVQYWIYYCEYINGLRSHYRLTNLIEHEKRMAWLKYMTFRYKNNKTAFETNMLDYHSREQQCCELFNELCEQCKNIINLTRLANVRGMNDTLYYSHKKDPDMRLYGYHPDEEDQELIDRRDEHFKWLTFEYNSESEEYDSDEDEYDTDRFEYARGRRYRIRPQWIDPHGEKEFVIL